MKTTLRLFLLALCLPLIITSCGTDEGCMSVFGTNYDKSATENCCCTYDVKNIVSELIGSYSYDDNECNSLEETQHIIIKSDPNNENGIIITNLYLYDEIEVPGIFAEGVFTFDYFRGYGVCNLRTIGTLKSDNFGLGLSLKHIGTNTLGNQTSNCSWLGFTCEGLLTKI